MNRTFEASLHRLFNKCIILRLKNISVFLRVPITKNLEYRGKIKYMSSNSVEGTYYKIKVKGRSNIKELYQELCYSTCFDNISIESEVDDDEEERVKEIEKIYNISDNKPRKKPFFVTEKKKY